MTPKNRTHDSAASPMPRSGTTILQDTEEATVAASDATEEAAEDTVAADQAGQGAAEAESAEDTAEETLDEVEDTGDEGLNAVEEAGEGVGERAGEVEEGAETEGAVDVVQGAVDLKEDVAEDAGDGIGVNSTGGQTTSTSLASQGGDLGDAALDEGGELGDLVLVLGGSGLVLSQGGQRANVGGGGVDDAGVLLDLRVQASDNAQDGADILALVRNRGSNGANEKAGESEGGEELHCG